MESEDFPANSRKAQTGEAETPKRVDRVTSGTAKRRKKSLTHRVAETFIGGDPKVAAQTMVTGVLIPALKDAIVNAVSEGIERLIHGEVRKRSGSSRLVGRSNYISYGAESRGGVRSDRPPNPLLDRKSRGGWEFEELEIESRAEAEVVIQRMYEILEKFDTVTVADLYDLTGIKTSHVDQKWGWTDLRGSQARRLRSGLFRLELPEPEPLTN